uniref:Uncharacterized protein n=1 Tax=Roseihalotalea indica TaxID=2867963 RepID=A0AA49JF37_9BACT|nr:hypothetical protein K4G66_21975 [Tunicatimonas sp. TK19036]
MGNHSTKELNEQANNYLASESVYSAIDAQKKLGVQSYLAYIEADSFIGNPYSLLGRVIMIRKQEGKCPSSINDKGFISEFAPLPITGIEIDENSKIEQPIKRGSIVVDKSLSLQVGFLNYLSVEFTKDSSFSLMVFDQLTGLVDVQSPSWQTGVSDWLSQNTFLLQDPDVCYLYAVIGLVQKNVIRKKYIKLDAKAGGGAYGVNLNGEIHTSNEDYFLDVRFGLTPVILKSPSFNFQLPKKDLSAKMGVVKEVKKPLINMIDFTMKHRNSVKYSLPNEDELSVFSAIDKFKPN